MDVVHIFFFRITQAIERRIKMKIVAAKINDGY